ncbi:hypothetical protein ABHN03_25300 [Paenibacillus sp. NRS-1775]|uniref:hypothetical protein n=1 Tax=unclassified Paenibacillus TaxID=185978 RepID=UPI003D2A9668
MNLFRKVLKYFKRIEIIDEDTMHSNRIESVESELERQYNIFELLLPKEFILGFRNKSYISGGCIYSLYHGDEPKDFDFFLSSKELAEKLKTYFMNQTGYHGSDISGGTYKGLPLVITKNAISIGKFQIITQWIGEPEDVVGEFDFKHNQFYYRNGAVDVAVLSDWSYLKGNKLSHNEHRARDIVGTILRTPKFIGRGMTITQREMAKVLLRLNEVGFSDKEVEQLESIDVDRHFSS